MNSQPDKRGERVIQRRHDRDNRDKRKMHYSEEKVKEEEEEERKSRNEEEGDERQGDEESVENSTSNKKPRWEIVLTVPSYTPGTHGIPEAVYKTGMYLQSMEKREVVSCVVYLESTWLTRSIELFRFLSIRAVYGEQVSPSIALDEVWHNVMLGTSLYIEMCEAVLSQWSGDEEGEGEVRERNPRGIIPHSALRSLDAEREKERRYKHTLSLYNAVYTLPMCMCDILWPETRDGAKKPNEISSPIGTVIKIFVELRPVYTMTLNINMNDTIEDVKCHIRRKRGIPLEQQRLIFDSKELKDESSLRDCEVVDGSTVYLALRIRGC